MPNEQEFYYSVVSSSDCGHAKVAEGAITLECEHDSQAAEEICIKLKRAGTDIRGCSIRTAKIEKGHTFSTDAIIK